MTADSAESKAAYDLPDNRRVEHGLLSVALDDLWGCIGTGEIADLQPGTVALAQAVHAALWHEDDIFSVVADAVAEVERQDKYHPSGYPPTRDGVRLGIATVIDEAEEARDAWRGDRCKCPTPLCGHAKWEATEAELMQTVAVALRTIRSIRRGRVSGDSEVQCG